MRLAMLRLDGREVAAVRHDRGWLPTEPVAGMPPGGDLAAVLRAGLDDALRDRIRTDAGQAPDDAFVADGEARFAPPFRHPRMVLGIGLNHRAHAEDLGTVQTDGPASFLKADHTIVGDGDAIVLPDPAVAARITSEAELGLVIGRRAWRVDEADALAHVAAVCCVLDQTAEDVLQCDPRFLTRAKNHPTFLSFGPELVTLDEVLGADGALDHLVVETVRNGEVHRAHAEDLGTVQTDGPASFLKADHTIVGDGDAIVLPDPAVAARITSEAELGLVIGRRAWRVDEADALAHVAAVCCVLDQTAEDVLQRDPRFLTRAKNHPTFLSFGPALVTLDELVGADGALDHLVVETVRNGEVHRAAPVADLAMGPAELVAFHSRVMPLEPGDLILTGTPGAAVVSAGDVMTCRIAGVGDLTNPVAAG